LIKILLIFTPQYRKRAYFLLLGGVDVSTPLSGHSLNCEGYTVSYRTTCFLSIKETLHQLLAQIINRHDILFPLFIRLSLVTMYLCSLASVSPSIWLDVVNTLCTKCTYLELIFLHLCNLFGIVVCILFDDFHICNSRVMGLYPIKIIFCKHVAHWPPFWLQLYCPNFTRLLGIVVCHGLYSFYDFCFWNSWVIELFTVKIVCH
jgi:hypothetical protein